MLDLDPNSNHRVIRDHRGDGCMSKLNDFLWAVFSVGILIAAGTAIGLAFTWLFG